MAGYDTREHYDVLADQLAERGISVEDVKQKVMSLAIETPSWGYGDSGTRFGVFPQAGVPRNIMEKIEDAAQVHVHTGVSPSVAIHIPWDAWEDYDELKGYAGSLGLRIGAVNPNVFQDAIYKYGSLCNSDEGTARKALEAILECISIAEKVDSDILSLWFADGTNYPGQENMLRRRRRMIDGLSEIHRNLKPGLRMLVEYKFFEPAFYHTDIADWGMALLFCQHAGEQAQVLVDMGHHALSTNVEHIVAILLDEGRLGGFHFNSRKYADDDLTTGSVNPQELFLIFNEIIDFEMARGAAASIVYMLDQSHVIKPKIEAMIQSITVIQSLYARALCVNRGKLKDLQESHDVVGAELEVRKAMDLDVEPLLAVARMERGLSADPLQAYIDSGYWERTVAERARKKVKAQGWAA